MHYKITKVLFATIYLWNIAAHGQGALPPISFRDFSDYDGEGSAVYLINRAETKIYHSQGRGWVARTSYQFRLRVLNEDGLDYANLEVDLYQGDADVERIDDIKATTYNINREKGLIDQVTLGKEAIFTKKNLRAMEGGLFYPAPGKRQLRHRCQLRQGDTFHLQSR